MVKAFWLSETNTFPTGEYCCTKIYLCINSDLMIMLYFCAYCCVVGVGVCETGNGK